MRAVCGWRRGIELVVALAVIGLAACGDSNGTRSTPGAPVLEPIGDHQVEPTRSLVLRLTASDPGRAIA